MNRFLVWLSNYQSLGIAAVRIAMGVVMLYHGWGKIAGDWGQGAVQWGGVPFPQVLGPVLTFVEVIGGIALILGLVTRFVGVVFTIEFLIIVVWVRLVMHGQAFPNWEKDLLLLGTSIMLATNGAGTLSLGKLFRQLEA